MNAFIYILLTPICYTFSFFAFVVTGILLGINWCLCGEYDHDKGLIGFLCAVAPCWILDRINLPLVRLHQSYKPAGWTWGAAVSNYRKVIRWWVDRAANDFEYKNAVKNNIKVARNGWERKFWTVVDRRAAKLMEKKLEQVSKVEV